MAHQLAFVNGKASIAFVGDIPWHGLGQELTDGATIETWKTEAGMDWSIKESPVWFQDEAGMQQYEGSKILYRGDTKEQLAVVGDSYKVVQPGEVLEFFRDLTEKQGMKLNTAGVLFGGRRFWALADTGRAGEVLKNDKIKGMLLLTTSCDGTMATTATFTSTRVVCNNTLQLSLNSDGKNANRVTHRTEFDPKKLKSDMGLLDHAWDNFMESVRDMTKAKVSDAFTRKFLHDLLKKPNLADADQPYTVEKETEAIMTRIKGGMGSDQAYGTMWGMLNGITEYCDHEMGRYRQADKKLWATWYGKESNLKTTAFNRVLEMV